MCSPPTPGGAHTSDKLSEKHNSISFRSQALPSQNITQLNAPSFDLIPLYPSHRAISRQNKIIMMLRETIWKRCDDKARHEFVGDSTNFSGRSIWQQRNLCHWLKNAVFWDVALCRSCVNRRFGGTHRLHLQGKKNPRARNQRNRWLQIAW
jgi:hypothetical protein